MEVEITFQTAQAERDCHLLAELAQEIWTEHYQELLGMEQIHYMLEKFQSAEKIKQDILHNGYIYWIAFANGVPCGYCAVCPKEEDNSLFISKIYIRRACRGNKIARMFFEKAQELARSQSRSFLWLTVNKQNSGSISVYEHLGFKITDAVVSDIGSGYVMDDYIMKYPL